MYENYIGLAHGVDVVELLQRVDASAIRFNMSDTKRRIDYYSPILP